MVRLLLVLLLLGQGGLVWQRKPVVNRALEFEVGVPEGWSVRKDATGLVAESREMGFVVTREPMYHSPDTFADAWGAQLSGAGRAAKVKPVRAGRFKAYHAGWDAGARGIQVYRLHVPDLEMLYNVSFSIAKGVDPRELIDGVTRSFKCIGKKPRLVFQKTAIGSQRFSMRLPVGYTKAPPDRTGRPGPARYVKTVSGYGGPHEAGSLTLATIPARRVQVSRTDVINGGDPKEVAGWAWREAQKKLGKVTKRPRGRGARYGGMKGHGLAAQVLSKDGLPKAYFCYAGRMRQYTVIVGFVVDRREVRLHRNLFRKMCATIRVRD